MILVKRILARTWHWAGLRSGIVGLVVLLNLVNACALRPGR